MSKVLLKDNPLDPGRGHQYTRDDGKEYCEFHEDYIVNVFKESEDETRTMSVRAPSGSKKLEIIGQDESVIVQFLVNSKHRSRATGPRVLLPKRRLAGVGHRLFFATRLLRLNALAHTIHVCIQYTTGHYPQKTIILLMLKLRDTD